MYKKKNILWILGFLVLFFFNVLVESIVLPALNLDNTEKNDIYFQTWWVVVAIWLLFGRRILKSVLRKPV